MLNLNKEKLREVNVVKSVVKQNFTSGNSANNEGNISFGKCFNDLVSIVTPQWCKNALLKRVG